MTQNKIRTFMVTAASFGILSATAFSIVLGFLANFTSILTSVGWLGVTTITLISIAVGAIRTTLKVNKIHHLTQLRKSALSTKITLGSALALVALSAITGIKTVQGTLYSKAPSESSPTSTSVSEMPTPGKTENDAVVFHYRKLATGTDQDRDLEFRTGGYVRQTFTARANVIQTITVIVSRPPEFGGTYSIKNIGKVRLMLHEVNQNNDDVGHGIPLQLLDSPDRPNVDGVLQAAGPNHQNTVFRLKPTKVQVGKRYAFTVINEEPDAILAFSLNTNKDDSDPMDSIGALNGDRRKITYFHVAGIVCNVLYCE
jgi:hypothetical protein